jgi:hypothetical protein
VRSELALALICGVALASCSVSSDYAGTNFACDDQHACPPGYICLGAGYCVTPDYRCGRLNVLADDFTDNGRGWEWSGYVAENGATLAEEGGEVIATPAAAGAEASVAYYQSDEWYRWSDASVYVEVTQSVSGAAGARAFLTLVLENGDTISIEQEADQLYFKRRSGGADTTLGSVRYDPVEHRWWRLRGGDGQVQWQTSADAFDWTTRFQEAAPEEPGLARIRFGAGADAGVADPGAAHFDNLNGGVSLGQTCRTSQIADDFEGSGNDGWLRSYEEHGATRDSVDGTAVVALADGEPSAAWFVSSSAYTLAGSELSVQVLDVPDAAAGVATWLLAVDRAGDYVGFRQEGDTLYFDHRRAGVVETLGTVLFDASEHRYWGISERDGEVRFSTSADGSRWETQVTAPDPVPLEHLSVWFGATAAEAPTGSAVARFDDLY